MPHYRGTEVWENCAIVISEHIDAELGPYLNHLLEWLYDLNDPGAMIILKRLIASSGVHWLLPELARCVKIAEALDDDNWLNNLSLLLANEALLNVLPEDVLEVLQNMELYIDTKDPWKRFPAYIQGKDYLETMEVQVSNSVTNVLESNIENIKYSVGLTAALFEQYLSIMNRLGKELLFNDFDSYLIYKGFSNEQVLQFKNLINY